MDDLREPMPIVLRTDERLEATNSLEKFHQFILEVKTDTYQWKWAIIALHNSAQAFMVLALKGTIDFNPLKPKYKKQWIKYFNSLHELPVPSSEETLYLDNFMSLYNRTKSNEMNMYADSKCFLSDPECNESMTELNGLRNTFIHFIPCGWLIYINGLPRICKRIILFIEFLITESGNIHYYDEFEYDRTVQLISDIKEELNILDEIYSIKK